MAFAIYISFPGVSIENAEIMWNVPWRVRILYFVFWTTAIILQCSTSKSCAVGIYSGEYIYIDICISIYIYNNNKPQFAPDFGLNCVNMCEYVWIVNIHNNKPQFAPDFGSKFCIHIPRDRYYSAVSHTDDQVIILNPSFLNTKFIIFKYKIHHF